MIDSIGSSQDLQGLAQLNNTKAKAALTLVAAVGLAVIAYLILKNPNLLPHLGKSLHSAVVIGTPTLIFSAGAVIGYKIGKKVTEDCRSVLDFQSGELLPKGGFKGRDNKYFNIPEVPSALVFNLGNEEKYEIKSASYASSELLRERRDEPVQGEIHFINGVGNTYEFLESEVAPSFDELIATASGTRYNVHFVHNASHGLKADFKEAAANVRGELTDPALCLINEWIRFAHENASNEKRLLQICHSQGVAHVRNALLWLNEYRPEIAQRIDVRAFAGAVYIPSELCGSVVHYIREDDPVPAIHGLGREMAERQGTLVNLGKSRGMVPDHEFSKYREPLEFELSRFLNRSAN